MSLPPRKATSTTGTNAVVQAVETYIQNQNLLGEIAELDELLYDLIDLHKYNEVALKRVLQCIYNLLQSNNRWNVKFGSKVFHKLISVVIAEGDDDGIPHGLHRQLVANLLICVQIHARKFPRVDGKFLLRQLWSLSLSSERQPHAAQILVQLFDDFLREMGDECACSSELHAVIQDLLQSEAREQRRSAHFLMRKLLMILREEPTASTAGRSTRVLDSLKCDEQQWSSYIVIMETLEEHQSHLVLPTLSTLLPRIAESNQEDNWLIWLRILYVRLLQDNNILVLRWTLEFFFNRFDVSKLCRYKLLPEFLAATNRTQLYNVESYFLPEINMKLFMSDETQAQEFLEALATVPWHSVPLHFWLSKLQPIKAVLINKKVLLQLSSRVRALTNATLRQKANELVFNLLETSISSLTLGDYLIFIETLFNVSDNFYDHIRLKAKIQHCENFSEEIPRFNKRCGEIIFKDGIMIFIDELLKQLRTLPSSQHGWWRFFPIFNMNDMEPEQQQTCLHYYRTQYNIDTEMFEKSANLEELQQHMLQRLSCQTKDEKSFVLEHCVDCFVRANLENWSQLKELHLQPCDLLESGTKATLAHLTQLLEFSDTRIEDEANVLSTVINLSNKHPNCDGVAASVVSYAIKFLSDDENTKLVRDTVNNRNGLISWYILTNAIPNSLILESILNGEITTGDARIELAYIDSLSNNPFDDVDLRTRSIYFLKQKPKPDIVNAICSELQDINKELNVKKPRYYENCKEHRIKIRIARALLILKDGIKWSAEMWNAVLSLNDQLNISYMYECLVAQLLPDIKELMDRMQSMATLKPSQQVSIISIAHIYCFLNWKVLELTQLQCIVNLLLPHTMGAHYQTRLFAQLVLHKLAVKCESNSMEWPILNTIKASIETTLGSKLHELNNETRLLLPEISSNYSNADIILYMTNTPFDEYKKPMITDEALRAKVEGTRTALKARRNPTPIMPEVLVKAANLNVQRKINPINDIYTDNDLEQSSEQLNEQELIVVASLIDKLPNLGGLARTCEVLGVKTLVLGAKSFALKSDFTNLSMTAEKTLNIAEVKPASLASYLIEKQSQGYKIVGAEQTAHSTNFTDFKFPEKCILLLGHEKHGIPVDLIALLDFAVEIPQFGVVRSLNVHVTGSLFIWEYCKQHIKK